MSWVKRNLYFLISSIVAVALLGLAGFYFYSNYVLNNENEKKLYDAYEQLDKLTKQNPRDDQVDNIKAARQDLTNVLALIEKDKGFFTPILSIPNPTNGVFSKDEFASALRRTIDELQHAAAAASVELPPRYNFSFQAEKNLTVFDQASLPPLSVKLGEIKVICNVLFQAKINSLDNLRRERVSQDDSQGPVSDYTDAVSVTNQLAVITPYEVTFHCFSPELAGVLAGFAQNPHGFVIKAVNVETGVVETQPAEMPFAGGPPAAFGGVAPVPSPVPVAAPPVISRGGLPVMLDEKKLKVTLVVDVIKLLPKN